MDYSYRSTFRVDRTRSRRGLVWLTVFIMTPALVGAIPLQSFALQQLWNWFFTSWLHMGRISYIGAIALVMLVAALTTIPQLRKHPAMSELRGYAEAKQAMKRLIGQVWGYLIFKPLIILGIGFVLHVV